MTQRRNAVQWTALLLWRSGMAFAAVAALYYGAWAYLSRLAWPTQVKAGVALGMSGLAMVLLSLILERRRDRASEGDLNQ